MSNFLNSNSKYVSSLVSYILDTKPYHSKLTEITEEYRFSDSMNVKVTERLGPVRVKQDSTWLSTFFSGGADSFQTMPVHQVHSPSRIGRSYVVGTEENTDFKSLPYVYSKTTFDGPGCADVLVNRSSGISEALLEGHDFFVSHGGAQIRIWQTWNANGDFEPLWNETRDEDAVSRAGIEARLLGNDLTNPSSVSSKLLALLLSIQTQTIATPTMTPTAATAKATALSELSTMIADLNAIPTGSIGIHLPRDYELLFVSLIDAGVLPTPLGYAGWIGVDTESALYVDEYVNSLSTSLYFNTYQQVDPETPGAGEGRGDSGVRESGRIGSRLEIKEGAPLEVWDIIKVNPMAYSRPVFTSNRYGWIDDGSGNRGSVLLNTSFANPLNTSTFILTATSATSFTITSTASPLFTRVIAVGSIHTADASVPFTFRINAGTVQPFEAGDRFYIGLRNDEAQITKFSMEYAYDLDPYDALELLDDTGQPLNFRYGSRFTDYDIADLNLTIQQTSVGAAWELRAIPDLARPIATLKKDGSGPDARVDLQALTSGIPPDVSSFAAPLYSMPEIPNSTLTLYYASNFGVYRNGVLVGTASATAPFSLPAYGISFDLSITPRPYIAAVSAAGGSGGDLITFTAVNAGPVLLETPIGLVSPNSPRLVMYGDAFNETNSALWYVSFTAGSQYEVTGTLIGTPEDGTLFANGFLSNEGSSFSKYGVQFTIVNGSAGLDAGDQFSFETYATKPSYLVHGSVSGFTAPAEIGVPYDNGFIGFTLEAPTAALYNTGGTKIAGTNSWVFGTGLISVTRIRPDAPTVQYALLPLANGWHVSREDIGIVGFLPLNGSFVEKYITITSASTASDDLTIQIKSHVFDLTVGHDTVILNPVVAGRLPLVGEAVSIDKRQTDTVNLNLDYGTDPSPPNLTSLGVSSISTAQHALSTATFSGVPLANTSPDTAIITNFVPLRLVPYDSSSSEAIFSDTAVSWKLYAVGSNEYVGEIQQTSSRPNWPMELRYDDAFYSTYLPLNAESNLIVRSNGTQDRVHVNIAESVKFLIAGGILQNDLMFSDTIGVSLTEEPVITVINTYAETATTVVDDLPYDWPAVGYDVFPYDTVPYDHDPLPGIGFTVQNPELVLTTVDADDGAVDVPVQTAIQDVMVMIVRDVNTDERTAIFGVDYPYVPQSVPVGTYADADTPFTVEAPQTASVFEFNFRGSASVLASMPDPVIGLLVSSGSISYPVVTKISDGKYQVTNPISVEAKLFLV